MPAAETPPQEPDDPELVDSVIVARVLGAHGVDGGLSIHLLSEVPSRFDLGRVLFVGDHSHTISFFRSTRPGTGLLWLDGISTRKQASSLAGQYVNATPDANPELEEGEYFHYQLIGMLVSTEEGEELGEIQEILETGSNDVYIVRGNSGELLIPATAQVVQRVDVAGSNMLVRLPDGLR